MKRKICLMLCGSAAILSACALNTEFKAEEDTVYLKKDGTVLEASIEDFNESYYDEEELKEYIEQSVSSYVQDNGDGSVLLDEFELTDKEKEGKLVKLYLEYSSYIDYAQFNNVEFFDGTVSDAQKTYSFDRNFLKVEKGKAKGAADVNDILSDYSNRVLVIGENTFVRLDGEILYISDGDVEITGKNTVKVTYDPDAAKVQPAYLVYKIDE